MLHDVGISKKTKQNICSFKMNEFLTFIIAVDALSRINLLH